MSSIFDDIGMTPIADDINSIITKEYLSEYDESLADLTRSAWLLVLIANLTVVGGGSEDPTAWHNISIEALKDKLKFTDSNGKKFGMGVNNDGIPIVILFLAYCNKYRTLPFADTILRIYNAQDYSGEEIFNITGSDNPANVSIFHLLLNADRNADFEKLVQHYPFNQDRTDRTKDDQVTEGVLLLENIARSRTDNRKEGQTRRDMLEAVMLVDNDLVYSNVFGPGVPNAELSQNLRLDDLVKFINIKSLQETRELLVESTASEALQELMSKDIISMGSTYQEIMRSAAGIYDGANGTMFPNYDEDFFKTDVFLGSIPTVRQIHSVPAFSYYCFKHGYKADIEVLHILGKGTVPNALPMQKKNISGHAPLAFLAMTFKIENDQWSDNEKAAKYKFMAGSVGANSVEELGKLFPDTTRTTGMVVNNYYGGISSMLKMLCDWYIEDRNDQKLSSLIQDVFPGYVTVNSVLNWGDKFGYIPKEKVVSPDGGAV